MRIRLLLGLAVAAAACGDKGTAPPVSGDIFDVTTIADAFVSSWPDTPIPVGSTVRWTFSGGSDGLGHNVRFNPRITGSPADIPVQKSGSVSRTFNTKGVFKYDCDVHPGMRAEITVQ